ncbi:MAG: FAD-dependent oxidoreductase [Acidimicrobiales bacterium]|jgi:glycine/D-amino acid oxidase-like deaminating enzyme
MSRVAPLTSGYRSTPYWWDGVDLPHPASDALPSDADVAVVGGGYTGLAVALEVARAGRSAVVLDRDDVAAGASSRNGGMVHPGAKRAVSDILALPGGRRIWDDSVAAVEGLASLCAELGIDCDWSRSGHIELAHHPRAAADLRVEAEAYGAVGEQARFIAAGDLGGDIGSTRFFGGLVVERSAGLHPAKLAAGLARGTGAAGAVLHANTAVLAVHRAGGGFTVETSRGVLRSGEVVVATNGTTDHRLVPWLGRRILGIGSFILATEPLDPDVASELSPRGRMFFDSRNLLHYWRLSPDGRRLLFGGRTSLAPTTVEQARDRLYAAMVETHPQVRGVRVERAWGANVGLTADRLPHAGRHRPSGVVYAMGYCGSGVAQSVHLGRAVGRWLAADGEPPVPDGRTWPCLAWPARVPVLLAAGGRWYKARDALGR